MTIIICSIKRSFCDPLELGFRLPKVYILLAFHHKERLYIDRPLCDAEKIYQFMSKDTNDIQFISRVKNLWQEKYQVSTVMHIHNVYQPLSSYFYIHCVSWNNSYFYGNYSGKLVNVQAISHTKNPIMKLYMLMKTNTILCNIRAY